MRSWSSLPTLAILLASCAGPSSTEGILTRMRYDGPGASEPYTFTVSGSSLERKRSQQILIGRAGSTPLQLLPLESLPQDPKDLRQAHRLAALGQWTIVRELGISDHLGLTVVVCPIADLHACVIETEIPSTGGIAFGVPSVGGEIPKEDASRFLFALTTQYVMTYLTTPILGECSMTHRDPRCVWIADGLAGIAATKALAAALRDKGAMVELAPIGYFDVIEAEVTRGRKTVKLTDLENPDGTPFSPSEALVHRAAAEYVAFRWYVGALKQKSEQPIAGVVAYLRGLPLGPAYEDMTEWMRRTSGVNVYKEAEAVPLEAVLAYHRANWLGLGWKRESAP